MQLEAQQMESASQAEGIMDMKMWLDLIQDFSVDDIDVLADCSGDHSLFVQQQQQQLDLDQLKTEMFAFQTTDASLYNNNNNNNNSNNNDDDDDKRLQKEQELSTNAGEFAGCHVVSACDLYAATPTWSEWKLWDDSLLPLVKEEQQHQQQQQQQHQQQQQQQPRQLQQQQATGDSEFRAQSAPSATLKVLRESRQLGIPSDPRLWSPVDVQLWATSALEKKSLRSSSSSSSSSRELSRKLVMDGSALCSLRSKDLERWIGNDEAAKALFVELELWRCAQQLSDSWSNSPSPSSSSLQYASFTTRHPMDLDNNNNNNHGHVESSSSVNNPLEIPALIQTFAPFGNNNNHQHSISSNNSNHHHHHHGNYQPRAKVHPAHAGAVLRPTSLAVQPSYFLDCHRHLSGTNDPVLPQFSFFMSPSSSSSSSSSTADGYGSSPDSSSGFLGLDLHPSPMTEVPGGGGGGSTDGSPASSASVQEFYEVYDSHGDLTENMFDAMPTSSARQGNQLWQFLKELLLQPCQYENCIRWLDRSKGIFKIEDSIRVAKLWGQRKNRPAMNYDKLSRSIRQYYKKGIIKKTSQSKRLVYQFCQKYA